MPRAGIALGSNLGDRLANIRAAIACLAEIADPAEPILEAPVYQTEPRLCPPGSPDFLNTVIEISFDGTPMNLLEKTQVIEKQLGRIRNTERNAPRIIDVDILYLGAEQFENGDLILPHPRIHERRFVLQPLADIRPDLAIDGIHVATMLDQLMSDEAPLERVAGTSCSNFSPQSPRPSDPSQP